MKKLVLNAFGPPVSRKALIGLFLKNLSKAQKKIIYFNFSKVLKFFKLAREKIGAKMLKVRTCFKALLSMIFVLSATSKKKEKKKKLQSFISIICNSKIKFDLWLLFFFFNLIAPRPSTTISCHNKHSRKSRFRGKETKPDKYDK